MRTSDGCNIQHTEPLKENDSVYDDPLSWFFWHLQMKPNVTPFSVANAFD